MINKFKGKKVLVTGHTGFKGSWLTLWLNILGADVIGISLDPEQDNGAFNAMSIKDLCTDIRQNINDLESVINIFQTHQPQIVFHLAAQPLVLDSYKKPIETFQTNVIGTANILEACRQTSSVKTIVVITTDKCYENVEVEYGYKETDRLGGKDPYSASKAAAEIVTSSYRESFFKYNPSIGLATVRAGNVIGGGDWANNRILPDCIRSLLMESQIEVRNPNAVRPWQHVLEPLGGYLLLASKLMEEPQSFSEPWNFGPNEQGVKNVSDVVNEVILSWGKGTWKNCQNLNQPHESKLLTLDISKAKSKLKWEPLLSFQQAIKFSVDWYKAQVNGVSMQGFGRDQILEYQTNLLEQNK